MQVFDELVKALQEVIQIDTQKTEAKENAPFGEGIKKCLDHVLELGKSLGFEVYNCDNYAGHIDFVGSESGVVAVLGHLDVVPANEADGWIHPPFSGIIDGGKMYGRGTMDDKGPMIACLYALKALKDEGFKPKKTIRLIFGCDEEDGMECIKYYLKKVAPPDIAFSPDGNFPVINREKGIMQVAFNLGSLDNEIKSIKGGSAINVVCGSCEATLGSGEVVTAHGKNAHASTPEEGENATWKLFSELNERFGGENLQFIVDKLTDYHGKKWGIDCSDSESGDLTCNIGTVNYDGKNLKLEMDFRFPISFRSADIIAKIKANTPYSFEVLEAKEPLYVPADSHLVETLLAVYNKEMGQNLEAISIGGGTYSRQLQNCVAFGPLFPNEEQTIHMPNEVIVLDNLKAQTKIYYEALKELSK